ncbi:MAG TPA: hypothetical protein VM638_07945 [Actinomycetota bacterium]|nr:hypothetical protein [Actinomycetota bacterium]
MAEPWTTRSWRGFPLALWLIAVLHALTLFVYSVLFPMYRAPDEHIHVDRVLAFRDSFVFHEFHEREIDAVVDASRASVAGAGGSRHLRAEDAPPRHERPPFEDVPPSPRQRHPNIVSNHPPLYYAYLTTASTMLTSLVPGIHWSWDLVVALLRLLTILLLVPLPFLLFATARRLRAPPEASLAAALVPLGIPMLTNIGSTVNNDNLLLALGGVLAYLVARIGTGDASVRTAVVAGVVGGLALYTKGFALTVPLWLVAGYAALARRAADVALAGRRLAVSLGLAFAAGGWWWLRNVLLFDRVQTGVGGLRAPAPPEFVPDWGWWLGKYASWLLDRFWGSFGRVDVNLPRAISLAATALVLLGVAWALVSRPRERGDRWTLAALLVPFLSLLAFVTYGATRAYRYAGQPVGFHGRYLYGGVPGLAVVAAVGWTVLLGRLRRLVPALAFAWVAVMQLVSVPMILRWYWGPAGPAPITERVAAVLAWSPWPPAVVVTAIVLTAAVGATTAVVLVRHALAPSSHSASGPDTSARRP